MSSSHLPYLAVVVIPAVTAAVSAVVRLTMLESAKDRAGIWNIFAVGPDLMIATAVAIPALLAGRNVGLAEIKKVKLVAASTKLADVNASWSVSGSMVLIIICLFLIGLSLERLWCKSQRQKSGFKDPLVKGILPPAACGIGALAAALVLGTP